MLKPIVAVHCDIVPIVSGCQFAYHRTMAAFDINDQLAKIASAIAEPARAKILCALMDNRARTSTELSVIAEVSPSTTSAHLQKLADQALVIVLAQGKHRYYQITNPLVAHALESLMVLAHPAASSFKASTPGHLQLARTCYDHMAGAVAVSIHDYLIQHNYLALTENTKFYTVTAPGALFFKALGIDTERAHSSRRQLACTCLDWSERRHHLGGALGAAVLTFFEQQQWLEKNLHDRALKITEKGKRQFLHHFKLKIS